MTTIAKIAFACADAENKTSTARLDLANFYKANGGKLTPAQEAEFDRVFFKKRCGLRADAAVAKLLKRGAKRTDAQKAALALARKIRQRAREDVGAKANDTRGGARTTPTAPKAPAAPAAPKAPVTPSAVSPKEAAAFLLAYSNKNAKVLPATLMREIKAFASKK
jgi:hypothetical protein